ncbi:oligopeptide transport system permease protein [Rhizobium sp. SG_E_25_P2]|uniref:ABC transporter permease subunit n=1 Tax=Rhizobium sp. SG_E_25_P2 TaxID=2879942 RepID=UPI002473C93D|nr:ABC transporter permease subunit [Rhizobium sp. SG_E_25_P2]MDH6267416.1 oligopeptide transport system permease protein [Rhizobium sp. SG_E_25_P2]
MSDAIHPTTPALESPDSGAGRSLTRLALVRLSRNKAAVASIFALALVALICFLGPLFNPHGYADIYPSYVAVPPSLEQYPHRDTMEPVMNAAIERGRAQMESFDVDGSTYTVRVKAEKPIDPRIVRYLDRPDEFDGAEITETGADGLTATVKGRINGQYFLLGTDRNGRDMLARIMVGGQISLMVGILATLVSLVIGVVYGAISGYLGGRVDNIMMRLVEILYSLPFIFFVIMLVVFFGRHIALIFIAIGAINWLDMARIVRGQTLAIKRREFVGAAVAMGLTDGQIIRRHIIPNTIGPVVVFVTLLVPQVILLESFLSFLGLGVQEPLTSWGVLIAEGASSIEAASWLLLYPSLFFVVTLVSLNFIGDGLRDAFDPKDR